MRTADPSFAIAPRRWATAQITRELWLSWRFVGRDASTTIIPGMLFLIAAWASHPSPATPLLPVLARGAIYFWLYVFIFCLSNQVHGVEEDRLNKPDRPLVRGDVSLRGAWQRWLLAMLIFPLVGWSFGVLAWALLWQAIVVLHNFGGWGRHWVTKNLAMTLGTLVQLGAAWQMAAPTISPEAWRWIILISLVVFPMVTVQDLRDLAGDRATGRRTFPLVFGESPTRWLVCAAFVGVVPMLHFGLLQQAGVDAGMLLCDAILAALCLTIAWRVLRHTGAHADHRTYMLFTYWYCAILATAIVVFAR